MMVRLFLTGLINTGPDLFLLLYPSLHPPSLHLTSSVLCLHLPSASPPHLPNTSFTSLLFRKLHCISFSFFFFFYFSLFLSLLSDWKLMFPAPLRYRSVYSCACVCVWRQTQRQGLCWPWTHCALHFANTFPIRSLCTHCRMKCVCRVWKGEFWRNVCTHTHTRRWHVHLDSDTHRQ